MYNGVWDRLNLLEGISELMDFKGKQVVIIPKVLNSLVERHAGRFLLLFMTASFYEILELGIQSLERCKQG